MKIAKTLTKTGGVRDLPDDAEIVIVVERGWSGDEWERYTHVMCQRVVRRFGQAYVLSTGWRLRRGDEGVKWARGWTGPAADALRAAVALS